MRAFVAVEIAEPVVLQEIRTLQSEIGRDGARPIDADTLHFTLQFLGEIPDDPQPIVDAVSTVRFESFDLEICGLGAFPNARSPRIIWIGAKDVRTSRDGGGKGLSGLAHKVSDALGPLNYTRDKRFVAHSTIFRIKRREISFADELNSHAETSFGVQRVSQFKLKKSQLTPKGPIYTDLAKVGATR